MAIVKAKPNETALETYERLEHNWRELLNEADSMYKQVLIAAEKVREENRERDAGTHKKG